MVVPSIHRSAQPCRCHTTVSESAGLKVSALSFGSWVTFATQMGRDEAAACMQAARDAGVNFFDNAEAYAGGESERIMGQVFADLAWPRESYVVSTKFYWGIVDDTPNMNFTLNRKYLRQAIEGSLERFGLDFVDLVFCHRADPDTPIEETVWAMHDMVESGQALYWGTSEWTADEIRAAWDIADRHHLHKPQMEQPQYHLLERRKVEQEYARLYEDIGLGLTTWSPLASGLLTGKYADGIPEGSRVSLEGYDWLADSVTGEQANERVQKLRAHRRRARLHHGAAGDRLVRGQPERVHRHHRRQPGLAGDREHGRARRDRRHRRRRCGCVSTPPSARRQAGGPLPRRPAQASSATVSARWSGSSVPPVAIHWRLVPSDMPTRP